MPLTPGARIGPYEIKELLGQGGMGEVYRARDSALNRDVAVKVLPEAFAADSERLVRFTREAQTLASLNHPNIALVFGLDGPDRRALVMELVEGEDLAVRIARGPLPIADALAIAKQIVDALEAAHEQGIIHRDLKPANIKVRTDGAVKVLDFGLAKLAFTPQEGPGFSPANLTPTITSPAMTQAGIILGTAAYMSPEQAAGKPVDQRSDVWAFGVVLMEMLTGQQTFGGESVSHVIASVLKDAPSWTALPAGTPASVRRLLQRCLEKDRRRRLADISDARFELDDALNPSAEPPTDAARSSRGFTWLPAVIGLLAGALLATLTAWRWWQPDVPPPTRPAQFVIQAPPSEALAYRAASGNLAVSPDGSLIVYSVVTANGQGTRLMVRSIDDLEARPLPDSENAFAPFVSPDGRSVGFVSGSGAIVSMPVSGSAAVPIMRRQMGGTPRGVTWGPDDRIVLANASPDIGLVSVRRGGEPEVLTTPDDAAGETDHVFPSFLPGGKAVLFTILAARPENVRVAVLDLTSGQYKTLIPGGSHAQFMNPGYLVFVTRGLLHAVRFDSDRLQVIDEALPIGAERVIARATGAAEFALSSTGTLAFIPDRGGEALMPRSLVWLNRRGEEEPTGAPLRAYGTARIAPDGGRALVAVYDDTLDDLWIWDFTRRTLERVTNTPGSDMSPIWERDGKHVIWALAPPGGAPMVHRQAADGTGAPEQLGPNAGFQYPTSMTADGRHLLIQQRQGPAARIRAMELNTGEAVAARESLLDNAWSPEVSPDGRWLAYQSLDPGRDENTGSRSSIYVRPFPNVDAGRVLISTAGGTRPAWAPNGRELFYVDGAGLLTAVPLEIVGSTLKAGLPTIVSSTPYFAGASALGVSSLRGYDVAPDGQRFLMIKETVPSEKDGRLSSLVVRLNLAEVVKARLSSK